MSKKIIFVAILMISSSIWATKDDWIQDLNSIYVSNSTDHIRDEDFTTIGITDSTTVRDIRAIAIACKLISEKPHKFGALYPTLQRNPLTNKSEIVKYYSIPLTDNEKIKSLVNQYNTDHFSFYFDYAQHYGNLD